MTPVRIALIYLTLASLWILLSDRVLYWLVAADSASFLFWQTTKGWLFVIASSVIIYLLAYRLSWALSRQLDLKRRHLFLVRRKAHTDYLTGLPNRRFGLRVMRRLLAQAERSERGFCVILLDLDDFKQVNDSLGHRAGDQLIVTLGQRLEAQLGPGEHLIRQGGDEFLLMCAGVSDLQEALWHSGIDPHCVILEITEGGETETQSLALERLGVEYLQGFWLARPMPAEEYRTLVHRQAVHA